MIVRARATVVREGVFLGNKVVVHSNSIVLLLSLKMRKIQNTKCLTLEAPTLKELVTTKIPLILAFLKSTATMIMICDIIYLQLLLYSSIFSH